jgi:hypothetical protein
MAEAPRQQGEFEEYTEDAAPSRRSAAVIWGLRALGPDRGRRGLDRPRRVRGAAARRALGRLDRHADGDLVDDRGDPARRHLAPADRADPDAHRAHRGRGHRALCQLHRLPVPRRLPDRHRHGEVEPAPPRRAPHPAPRRGRADPHRARADARHRLPLHVGVEHRHDADDAADRALGPDARHRTQRGAPRTAAEAHAHHRPGHVDPIRDENLRGSASA